jgi:hypothetical protein
MGGMKWEGPSGWEVKGPPANVVWQGKMGQAIRVGRERGHMGAGSNIGGAVQVAKERGHVMGGERVP